MPPTLFMRSVNFEPDERQVKLL